MPTVLIRLDLQPDPPPESRFQIQVAEGARWTTVYSGPGVPLGPDPIAAPTPIPTPPSVPSPTPGTPIFQDNFESGNLGQWSQEPATGRWSVDTAHAKSGTRSARVLFTPQQGYGMLRRSFFPGYDALAVRFHVLFEPGFVNRRDDGNEMHFFALVGNRIDQTKSSYGTAGRRPNGTDFFYAGVDPEQNPSTNPPSLGPWTFYTYWPDQGGNYGTHRYQPTPKVPLVPGQWQEVRHEVRLNTPGQANGSQTLWVNGTKCLEQLGMRWRNTTALRINELMFPCYMPGAPQTQSAWIDDVWIGRP